MLWNSPLHWALMLVWCFLFTQKKGFQAFQKLQDIVLTNYYRWYILNFNVGKNITYPTNCEEHYILLSVHTILGKSLLAVVP